MVKCRRNGDQISDKMLYDEIWRDIDNFRLSEYTVFGD